jgi:hypothetical protein
MRKASVSIVIPFLTLTAISGPCQGKDSGKSIEGVRGDTSPLKKNMGAVHVLADVDSPDHGIFPTNIFTVPDDTQLTGLRVNMPLPDCSVRVSDCNDIGLINVLDGFNIQPRVTVPFDGDVDPTTVNSSTAFFIELPGVKQEGEDVGEGQDDEGGHLQARVVGVNQVVWDPPTHVLAVESDEQLRQHTTYAFVVTRGVLDASGAPVVAATVPPGLGDDDEDGEPPADSYSSAVWRALQTLKHSQLKLKKKDVAGLSVFTTQSVTAMLEHIRDELKAATPDPATFLLGPGGSSTVFSLSDVQAIDWQQQTKVSPPAFQAFAPQYVGETKPLLLLDQYNPGAVGRIAYGTFRSPRYITDEPIMPPVGTLAGVPPVVTVDTLYLNLFLPAGTPPPGGWPVVIFGVGGGDYKEESPFFYAAGFASHGIATAGINVVGQGFGPLSFLKVTLKNGSVVQFPSGGRSKDLDGNGTIAGASEGVTTISPPYKTQAARDAIRQQAIDLMQLARVIEVGVDVDGDGLVDLDPSQISYFGISFGAGAFGQLLMAVDPSPKSAVFASPGGLNGRFDFLRMRPSARSQVGAALAARVPSLLNSPGLTSFAGIPVGAPYFNENIPLRNQPVVTTHVDGAMDIQKFFDNVEWIAGSGDGVSYTPYIRKEPLAGNSPKALLVNFGRGDQTAPNPRGAQFVRTGGYADVTTFYRNDLAYAEDHTVNKNPHTYLQRWMLAGLSGPIARGGIEQVATFLASGGQTIVHPEPARFFEVPISVLPEDFGYIP